MKNTQPRQPRTVLVCVVALATAMLFMPAVGCGDGDGSFAVVLNFVDIDGAHNGKKLYGKMSTESGSCGTIPATHFGEASIAGGEAQLKASSVAAGNYKLCAFIDVNGNAGGGPTSLPDSGDIVGETTFDITSDTTSYVYTTSWSTL